MEEMETGGTGTNVGNVKILQSTLRRQKCANAAAVNLCLGCFENSKMSQSFKELRLVPESRNQHYNT
jgi:hypothetical protein